MAQVELIVGGLRTPPAIVLEGTAAGEAFGTGVLLADVDADGFADAVVGAPGNRGSYRATGYVAWYHGGPDGFGARAGEWRVGDPGTGLGSRLIGGDFDGDGIDDVAAASPEDDYGVVHVWLGSSSGPAEQESTAIAAWESGPDFGLAMAGRSG